ncbi:MAG: hypothetical protein AB7H77_01230 [Bdellovibrionales bacterium]
MEPSGESLAEAGKYFIRLNKEAKSRRIGAFAAISVTLLCWPFPTAKHDVFVTHVNTNDFKGQALANEDLQIQYSCGSEKDEWFSLKRYHNIPLTGLGEKLDIALNPCHGSITLSRNNVTLTPRGFGDTFGRTADRRLGSSLKLTVNPVKFSGWPKELPIVPVTYYNIFGTHLLIQAAPDVLSPPAQPEILSPPQPPPIAQQQQSVAPSAPNPAQAEPPASIQPLTTSFTQPSISALKDPYEDLRAAAKKYHKELAQKHRGCFFPAPNTKPDCPPGMTREMNKPLPPISYKKGSNPDGDKPVPR